MIGIVIVSHSARLAEGVVELANQVAQDKVKVVAAGGTDDPANPIGTDAFRVLAAIEAADSGDGVLVLTDLGSAILSAETAFEFLDESRRKRVRLSDAPLVEGAIAAVSLAAAGGTLDEIVGQTIVFRGLPGGEAARNRQVTLPNPLGLHARPAARLIRLARGFDTQITLENLTTHIGPVDANSLNGLLSLQARQHHQLLIRAQNAQALTELAAFIESGCGDAEEAAPPPSHPTETTDEAINGIGAASGIAIAPLIRFRTSQTDPTQRTAADSQTEWNTLQSALAAASHETQALYDWARHHIGENQAGIFDAQSLLLEDPALIDQSRRLIFEDHRDAASAWHAAANAVTNHARAADLSDIAARVLEKITGPSLAPLNLTQPAIVAAYDLLPSQIEKLDPALVLGLCLETGAASAHASILARARGIPTVVGLGIALSTIPEGTIVAIDGERGQLWISPDEDQRRRIEERHRQTSPIDRHIPAATRDGRRITLLANLNRESQATEALASGAEGVGVLRTEFLFSDRQTAPDEEEQFACYRNIAETLAGRPLVIRTLDIGGDKVVPYLDIGPESNPFLGWRGIRISLSRPDLFETQLRAILRAGQGHPVEILLPMISTLQELLEAKSIIRKVEHDLHNGAQMPIGVMIEVPSAAVIADQLAAESSRLSIGTNDLVQYVMAADRTNPRVSRTADNFQPAVLRMIQTVVNAGRRAGIRVDVCGEMAADPMATPLLLGLGVEELSMSPTLIPDLKRAIARWTVPQAEGLAKQALNAQSSDAVRQLVSAALS